MALEIEGKLVRKLNVQSGTSAKGTWEKQEFVVEIQGGNYPSSVCFSVWGTEKVKDLEKFQVGEQVKVSFDASSREYNGKWYTDLRAWRMEKTGTAQQSSDSYAASAGAYSAPTGLGSTQAFNQAAKAPVLDDASSNFEDGEDLPF